MAGLTDELARRAAERAVAQRQAGYAREMERIVDAALAIIERSGNLNPPLREVLAESGLSTQAFYRYFRSKDELLLILLDAGRQGLTTYLVHRMERTADPAQQVEEWIRGVMAQAADPRAAGRTRPFAVGEDRIAEQFPVEHRASVQRLSGLLNGPVATLGADRDGGGARTDVESDVRAVYDLTFAALRRHLIDHTSPGGAEVDHLIGFALRGIGGGRSAPLKTSTPG